MPELSPAPSIAAPCHLRLKQCGRSLSVSGNLFCQGFVDIMKRFYEFFIIRACHNGSFHFPLCRLPARARYRWWRCLRPRKSYCRYLLHPRSARFVSAFLEIFASVVIKASMVHIFGWIMPEPFAIPPMVTVSFRPRRSNVTATSFSFVSVVMIAFAARCPASQSLSSCCLPAYVIPCFQTSRSGSCIPITPVEPISTPSSGIAKDLCRFFCRLLDNSSMPSAPVHAFAMPELIDYHVRPVHVTGHYVSDPILPELLSLHLW